jgi:anhydro-N-acetylmuramic acid kinase
MNILEKISGKRKKLIVGLMSGTSADGIDGVLVEVRGSGKGTRIRQLGFQTYPYSAAFKKFLLRNSDPATARLDDLTRLNVLMANQFADAAKKIVRRAGKRLQEVDLIGSHGQTIQHLPNPKSMFGHRIHATLQIGSPSVIAKLTGITTIGDFRLGDVAVGGSGAPLVPYVDYLLLRSARYNRAVLNIGGIANLTLLPKRCSLKDVVAFDTGPGNMVIDSLTQKFFHRPFDKDGAIANRGKLLPSLLTWMVRHPYLKLKPPKSTGRETFGKSFVREVIRRSSGHAGKDIIASASEFTALSVYLGYFRFLHSKAKLDELLVSGGGSRNSYLMDALRSYFSGVKVTTTDATPLPSRAKEAICFAVLANETIAGNPSNVIGATGASRETVLGTICLP